MRESVVNYKKLVQEYYSMWNSKDFSKAAELLDSDVRFRGSLDIEANGLDGFLDYANLLISAFPNLYHAIEISVFEGDTAAVYVTYTGKHEGEIFGYAPTHKRICYTGASFFHFKNEKIYSINVLGDLNSLHKQLQS
jgi:predicted ester cyclase